MKKPKSALLYFLAALGVIELITILFLGMWGFRPLIPDVAISPNWEAWQLLSTILLAIATLYLTWHIAKRQEQLTKKQDNLANLQAKKELETKELELKISLYDKRYKIYECLKKCTVEQVKAYAEAGRETVMEFDGKKLNGSEALYMMIFNKFTNGPNEQAYIENINLWIYEIQLVEQAEFCFDAEESQLLINYVKAVFEYASPIKKERNEEEFFKVQNELLNAIEKIESQNLIANIKNKLKLSYQEINAA